MYNFYPFQIQVFSVGYIGLKNLGNNNQEYNSINR